MKQKPSKPQAASGEILSNALACLCFPQLLGSAVLRDQI